MQLNEKGTQKDWDLVEAEEKIKQNEATISDGEERINKMGER